MQQLTNKQICEFRSKAHKLKPLVIIGTKGLTSAVNKEIDHALEDHELIKIRINVEDRGKKRMMIEKICLANNAELIQAIGHIVTVYRKRKEKK